MRRIAGICVWLIACGGCTLAFDTGSVAFDEQRRDAGGDAQDDAGRDAPEVTETDTDDAPDAPDIAPDTGPKPVAGLGELCGIDTPLCVPEDAQNWPDCAHAQCQTDLGPDALCLFATSPFGYCTRPCTTDSQCTGDPRSPFAASMRCAVDDGGDGYCVPGSQNDCAEDATCPAGEACKLARTVFVDGLNVGRVCQTETSGGVGPGQACVDDPRRSRDGVLRFCANDFCFDDICAALCDEGTANDDTCGDVNLTCRGDYLDLIDFSTLRRSTPIDAALCLPRTCTSPLECTQDAVCTPGITQRARDAADDGVCRADNPQSRGSDPLGEGCEDDGSRDHASCASRYCAGYPPNYYCSALCDTDDDCGAEQLCAVDTIYDANGRYFSRICRYAPGSKARCDRNGDPACPGGEVCAPFICGEVVQNASKLDAAHAEGRCVRPVQGGIRSGNACGEQECVAPDACVRFPGAETAQCVTVCGAGRHCENEFDICLAQAIFVGGEDTVDGEDLILGICSL